MLTLRSIASTLVFVLMTLNADAQRRNHLRSTPIEIAQQSYGGPQAPTGVNPTDMKGPQGPQSYGGPSGLMPPTEPTGPMPPTGPDTPVPAGSHENTPPGATDTPTTGPTPNGPQSYGTSGAPPVPTGPQGPITPNGSNVPSGPDGTEGPFDGRPMKDTTAPSNQAAKRPTMCRPRNSKPDSSIANPDPAASMGQTPPSLPSTDSPSTPVKSSNQMAPKMCRPRNPSGPSQVPSQSPSLDTSSTPSQTPDKQAQSYGSHTPSGAKMSIE